MLTLREPDFPVRLAGAALSANGTVGGGVNHRFKNLIRVVSAATFCISSR